MTTFACWDVIVFHLDGFRYYLLRAIILLKFSIAASIYFSTPPDVPVFTIHSGFLSDVCPIYGMRRKPYLTIGALVYSAAFVLYSVSSVDNVVSIAEHIISYQHATPHQIIPQHSTSYHRIAQHNTIQKISIY